MSIKTIYCDMDGVLCAFADGFKYFLNLEGYEYDESNWVPEEIFIDIVKKHDVFERLDMLPNAYTLLSFLEYMKKEKNINIVILSSVSTKEPENAKIVAQQKTRWLTVCGITHPVIFVSCAEEKANYASSEAILIDDLSSAVEPFSEAGGIGILYTDSDNWLTVHRIWSIIDKKRSNDGDISTIKNKLQTYLIEHGGFEKFEVKDMDLDTLIELFAFCRMSTVGMS